MRFELTPLHVREKIGSPGSVHGIFTMLLFQFQGFSKGGRLEEFKWRKPEHSEIRTLLGFPWIQVLPPESVQETRFQALWQDRSWKPLWFSTDSNL